MLEMCKMTTLSYGYRNNSYTHNRIQTSKCRSVDIKVWCLRAGVFVSRSTFYVILCVSVLSV